MDCINAGNVYNLRVLLALVQPVWSRSAARVRGVRTAADCQAQEVRMATDGGWQEELRGLMVAQA